MAEDRHRLRSVPFVHGGVRAYAATLLVAGALKAYDPWIVFGGLAAVGFETNAIRIVVALICGVEVALGAGLLVALDRRLALAAAVLSLGLMVGHGALLSLGAPDCGCYGNVRVADHWVFMVSGLGGVLCALVSGRYALVSLNVRAVKRARMVAFSLFVVGATVPLAAEVGDAPLQRLLVSARGARPEVQLVVLGAWDCPHCREVLREISSRSELARRCVFVVSEHDIGRGKSAGAEEDVLVVRIQESDWWRLIDGRPPSMFRVDERGRLVARGEDLVSVWPEAARPVDHRRSRAR